MQCSVYKYIRRMMINSRFEKNGNWFPISLYFLFHIWSHWPDTEIYHIYFLVFYYSWFKFNQILKAPMGIARIPCKPQKVQNQIFWHTFNPTWVQTLISSIVSVSMIQHLLIDIQMISIANVDNRHHVSGCDFFNCKSIVLVSSIEREDQSIITDKSNRLLMAWCLWSRVFSLVSEYYYSYSTSASKYGC